MTIRNLKAALAGSALVALSFGATTAQAATATADARARILSPITVTRTADLDYGTIVTGAAASTVDVSAAGARTCGAGLVCSGTTTAAAFTIVGSVGATVTLAAGGPVTLTSGANSMSSSLFTSSATLVLDGTDAFTVGGTLSVGASQADGVYVGNFTVTVNYQ